MEAKPKKAYQLKDQDREQDVFVELIKAVEMWSNPRGILDQSTVNDQLEKYEEERREMELAIDCNDRIEIMDAIGDQAVCLANAYLLAKRPDQLEQVHMRVSRLREISREHCLFFIECCQMALDEIWNRKGLMIDGKFVKYSNLTPEQQARCDETQ